MAAGTWAAPRPHLLQDAAAEALHGFSLESAFDSAQRRLLLVGVDAFLTPGAPPMPYTLHMDAFLTPGASPRAWHVLMPSWHVLMPSACRPLCSKASSRAEHNIKQRQADSAEEM